MRWVRNAYKKRGVGDAEQEKECSQSVTALSSWRGETCVIMVTALRERDVETMTGRNLRRNASIFYTALMVWLLLTAQRVALPHAAAQPIDILAQIRAHSWTFATDQFQVEAEGYYSPVARAPYVFTAAAVHLNPGVSADEILDVALRLRADGGAWSPWYTVGELEPQADGRLYGDNLAAWPGAREVQVRVSTAKPLPDAVKDMTVVAIDAQDGPTAAQAAQAAQQRATEQPAEPGVPLPVVISRAEWGANEAWMTWPPEYTPVDKVIVHHTVSGGGSDPAAEVRSIYYYHAITRGWGDIGYNYLVDKYGNVYEGRYGGPDVIGGHVSSWNEGSLGVSVLGCYDNAACNPALYPTAATLDALSGLSAWAASRHAIDPRQLRDFDNGSEFVTNYVLAGHRDYAATTCPGGNLYAELPGLRQAAWDRLPDYDVRFGWHDTPATVSAGQPVTVYPNLYNYGRLVWSDAGGVRLGYRWLQNGQVVAENTAAAHIFPGAEVNFGEMTALVASFTAPLTPGAYTLRWDLYRDGVGWFAEQLAPAGRSEPLEVTVEVQAVAALDVRLTPAAVASGETTRVGITVEGGVGQGFEVQTTWPASLQFVTGSEQRDDGTLSVELGAVIWSGALATTAAQASFDLLALPPQDVPLALSITTTLTATGYAPLTVERRLVVNGLHAYLPLVARAATP